MDGVEQNNIEPQCSLMLFDSASVKNWNSSGFQLMGPAVQVDKFTNPPWKQVVHIKNRCEVDISVNIYSLQYRFIA